MRQLPRALLVIFSLVLVACDGAEEIVHGLSELEANQILVVLDTQGIDGDKLKEEGRLVTWAIAVAGSDSSEALKILVANRLPKERSSGLKEVYPPGAGGLIPTRSEEKAKFIMAVQGDIESMLKSFPGVQEARVAVVLPEKDIIRDLETPPPPATASVALVYNPEADGQPPLAEDRIKKLVSAAVEDLKPANVQVVMKPNRAPLLLGLSATPAVASVRPIMGIKVLDGGSRKKLMGIVGITGLAAVLGLVLGIFGLVRSISLRTKLRRSESELTSIRRSRRE